MSKFHRSVSSIRAKFEFGSESIRIGWLRKDSHDGMVVIQHDTRRSILCHFTITQIRLFTYLVGHRLLFENTKQLTMNEHTTLRGGDEGYGNSIGLTRQGPLELPYVRISSWALNPSSCDSTQQVGGLEIV